jgi:hypothetical protein
MSDQSLEEVVARLEAVERQHRSLKRALVVALLSLVGVAAVSGPPKTIEAEEFVLKDGGGQVRARLALSEMIYALPPSPGPSPDAVPDPLDRLDLERRTEPKVQAVKASTACLTFMGRGGSRAAEQCTSWEDQPQTSLRFRVGQRDQFSLSADNEGAVLSLGGMRSRRNPEDLGRLAIGAHREGAWLRLDGPPNKNTLLDLDALTISDESGPPRVFPGQRKP